MLKHYRNKILTGDCRTILATIEDNTIDVCFADPPFNLAKPYNQYYDRKPKAEYLEWSQAWLSELVRITKPTGSIFVYNIPKWLTHYASILNNLAYFQHWIVWDSLARPCGNTLLPAHYGILFYTKQPQGFTFNELRIPHQRCSKCHHYIKDYGGKPRNSIGHLLTDVWADISRIQNKRLRGHHPCPLPEKLIERIILISSNPGDLILDPFCGTGTTPVVAKRLGRPFVGIDIDPTYVAFAKQRLHETETSSFRAINHRAA
jgi:site-specific DNA-methyltransferase (adenine-specific)